MLLDLMMPRLNGRHFLDEQRASETLSKVPVVVMAAYPNSAMSVLPDGFLAKPLNFDELLAVIERYCGPGEDVTQKLVSGDELLRLLN